MPEALNRLQNILVIRLDNAGDVIMLGPSLRALRQNFPGCRVTLLASPGGALAADLLQPWLDDVMVWQALWQELNNRFGVDPGRELELFERLQERNFDAAFIFTSFSQSPYPPAYACYLAGIPVRVGHTREFGGGLLSHWYQPPVDELHQAERNLALLEAAGLTIEDRQLAISIPDRARQMAREVLKEAGVSSGYPYILYAPGASAAARRYDLQRAAQAARLLSETTGMPVLIGGSQREKEILDPVIQSCDGQGVISLVGRTSLSELAAIIENAALVVANNSASLHLADALHRPMVILYSGTDDLTQWEPRQAPAELLYREVPCAPCRGFQCPYGMECLDIEPQEVVQAALRLLTGGEHFHAREMKPYELRTG